MDEGSMESLAPAWRSFVRPVVLELTPVISFVCACIVAGILFALFSKGGNEGLIGFVPPILSLVFGFSGLGWLSVGERRWGWAILGCRLFVVVAALVMGISVFGSALGEALCECPHHDHLALTPAFVSATVVMWVIALASPIVSTVALSIWLSRQPRGITRRV